MEHEVILRKLRNMRNDLDAIMAELDVNPEKIYTNTDNRMRILKMMLDTRYGAFQRDLVTASEICDELNQVHITQPNILMALKVPVLRHEFKPTQVGVMLSRMRDIHQVRGTRNKSNIRLWCIHKDQWPRIQSLSSADRYDLYEFQKEGISSASFL